MLIVSAKIIQIFRISKFLIKKPSVSRQSVSKTNYLKTNLLKQIKKYLIHKMYPNLNCRGDFE